jgi:putative FmdB family regulatory protein
MPIYLYECEECSRLEEKLQSLDDAPPECCGKPMKKLVSLISGFKIGGSVRRKWCKNWTPDSKPISTGSHHGERY